MTRSPSRVALIIPAFNEAATLPLVLSNLEASSLWDEVVVVSDGSTDDTADIARQHGVKTLELAHNRGKGFALAAGVAATDAPVLLFVDGDLLNLRHAALGELLAPVVTGQAGMTVGIRHRNGLFDGVQLRFGPLLSGIRAVRRDVFLAVPPSYLEGFRVETALNHCCRRLGWPLRVTVLGDVLHRVKERKRGLVPGLLARIRMFSAVFLAWLRLTLTPPELATPAAGAQCSVPPDRSNR